MAYRNPNAPIIARYFATRDSGKRWVISSDPGNTIDGYSGIPEETEAGHITVDGNNAGPTPVTFVRLTPPELIGADNDQNFTMWNGIGVDAFMEIDTNRMEFQPPAGGNGLTMDTAKGLIQNSLWSTGPVPATYANTWGSGAGSRGIYVHLDAQGYCHLSGRMSGGILNNNAIILPSDCKPIEQIQLPSNSNGAYGSIRIDTTGGVVVTAGATTQVSLSGISFATAAVG